MTLFTPPKKEPEIINKQQPAVHATWVAAIVVRLGAGALGSKDGHCELAPAGKQPHSIRL